VRQIVQDNFFYGHRRVNSSINGKCSKEIEYELTSMIVDELHFFKTLLIKELNKK